MEQNEEYEWISRSFKGELWNEAKSMLLNVHGFAEVEGQHFKSPHTDIVYRFVLKRDTDLFITRIDTFSDNKYSPVEHSVSNRIDVLKQIEDKKRERKEVALKMQAEYEFEFGLTYNIDLINSYWTYYQRQNHKYRKNKEHIDWVIKMFNNVGFDFSRDISILDALMIEEDYCVLEFKKRTNNKNLLKTIYKDGHPAFLYKAKSDESFKCLYSGILVQNVFGMDMFIKLHVNDDDE